MTTNNPNPNPNPNPPPPPQQKRKRSRWDSVSSSSINNSSESITNAADRAKALKSRISAQLAALKQRKAAAAARTSILKPTVDPPKKKAKVYSLDLDQKPDLSQIRTVKLSGGQTNDNKSADREKKPKINPYLLHRHEVSENARKRSSLKDESDAAHENGTETLLDSRIDKLEKLRKRHLPMSFIKPGVFIEKGERTRAKEESATKAGYATGRKDGGVTDVLANDDGEDSGVSLRTNENDVLPPPAYANEKSNLPFVVEWWDVEFLPSKLKKEINEMEAQAMSKKVMFVPSSAIKSTGDNELTSEEKREEVHNVVAKNLSISHCKSYKLVQHPVPIKPAYAATMKPKVATLHLTKKEIKRQRKLRRAERQRELQDKQAMGLVPAPEPRLTMANFMQVIGDQAVLDPSKIEAVVAEKVAARRLKHEQANLARKLTPKERAEKKFSTFAKVDLTKGLSCALFYVRNMSHPYHRAKVDLNAQQWSISGGVIEVTNYMSLVIAEGSAKSIKRFVRLMTVRMKWSEEDGDKDKMDSDTINDQSTELNEDGAEELDVSTKNITTPFDPNNECALVWQGSQPKRNFKNFLFQTCTSAISARKVLEAKGLGHFWDQIEQYKDESDA